MEEDMNNYDLEHVCADHPIMSAETWRGVYRDAWARYYSDAHVETVLRRAVASGINPRKIVDAMTVFSGSSRIEGVHPLQFGYVRRKIRTQRRHGLKIVGPLVFYPWRAWDFLTVAAKMARARVALPGDSSSRRWPTRTAPLTWTMRCARREVDPAHDFVDRLRRQDSQHLRRAEARARGRGVRPPRARPGPGAGSNAPLALRISDAGARANRLAKRAVAGGYPAGGDMVCDRGPGYRRTANVNGLPEPARQDRAGQ